MSTHDYRYPAPYSSPHTVVPSNLMADMATGAMVGAAAVTAARLHQPAEARGNAVGAIIKAGAISGVATGAVSMVRQKLGCEHKAFTLAAMFATGAVAMYALHSDKTQTQED